MRKLAIALAAALVAPAACLAQGGPVKNAAKSVLELTTYRDDGSVLATSHGAFVSEGEAISDLKPFLDCARATVTDTKGRTLDVTRMIGVNELYDVAFFRVGGKAVPCPVATSAGAPGSVAWLVPYAAKSPAMEAVTVRDVETFMDEYSYYIMTMDLPEDCLACPIVNGDGQVMGLAQPSSTGSDVHAADARFIVGLGTTGMSFSDHSLNRIGIPPALPKGKDEALLMLMMMAQEGDSMKLAGVADDFMAEYPSLVDGYSTRARMHVAAGDCQAAARLMETAIDRASSKDEAHFAYSRVIYDAEVSGTAPEYGPWSLDRALEEVESAYAINPQDVYKIHLARVKFAKGEYREALDTYMPLTRSTSSNAELFYEAALCRQMMGDSPAEVIALLDSAIVNTDTLRIRDAAPYFFARAEMYNQADSFRQAVFDYTRYEILVDGKVTSHFYYLREQAEISAKLYQQALVDIYRAIVLSPDDPTYYAEKASLELKVNMFEEALATAEKCVEVDPEYATGYLLLGLAQLKTDRKAEGLVNVEKARDLGEEQAQGMIDKYFR